MVNHNAQSTMNLENGIQIWIRPMQENDTKYLVDLFEHMGPQSRYLRFNEPLNGLDSARIWDEAFQITHADPQNQRALLAFADVPDEAFTAVGGARFVRSSDPQVAEIGISVRDDFQGFGIGTQLLRNLLDDALRHGITTIAGSIRIENTVAVHMLHRIPPDLVSRELEGMSVSFRVDITKLYQ